MQTESKSIHSVLSQDSSSFFIPPFQRAYSWKKTEIERYFEDIIRIAESIMDKNEIDKLEHFFGTIVVSNEKHGLANRTIIIDGQQRITTTLLFLIALSKDASEEQKNYIKTTYLINDSSSFEDKIKLKQVTKDWDEYKKLVNENEEDISTNGSIYKGYKIFLQLIKKRADREVNTYLKAIKKINLAVIILDKRPHKGEYPQTIFETLNSLGKPLTLADLIRNFVLLGLDSTKQTEIYDDKWFPKIEEVLADDTSKFFRTYLQYKKSTGEIKVVSDNNTKEIYQQFKSFVQKEFDNDKEAFVEDIIPYVEWYRWIITEENSTDNISEEATEYIRNIFHDIKATTFESFVLGLLKYHQSKELDDDTFVSTLKTIRTYLIRRRVLKLTSGENKDIPVLCKEIERIAKKEVSMLEILSNLQHSLRFPNDNEITKTLKELDFYNNLSQYRKFILGKIGEHSSKVHVNFRDKKITIEHIMPQTLNADWQAHLGDDYEYIHNEYLHNIGNLILTEFNSEMGNKSFSAKKQELQNSNISYRLDIIKKESWNEEVIKNHRDNMISKFLEIFPLPHTHKTTNNWNEKLGVTIYPPDCQDDMTGTKPKSITIDKKTIQIKHWSQVLVECIKYLQEKNDLDVALQDQKSAFGDDNVCVRWKDIKAKEDNDKKKYVSIENKKYYKIEGLNDDTIFIHTNMNANKCIKRIARMMKSFNLSKTFIQITL